MQNEEAWGQGVRLGVESGAGPKGQNQEQDKFSKLVAEYGAWAGARGK